MSTSAAETKDALGWWLMILVVAVLASAMAVVYAKHINRKLFIELQALMDQRDNMNIEWGRLQLEQSTFSTHSNIERIAREKLKMHLPDQEEIVFIQP